MERSSAMRSTVQRRARGSGASAGGCEAGTGGGGVATGASAEDLAAGFWAAAEVIRSRKRRQQRFCIGLLVVVAKVRVVA